MSRGPDLAHHLMLMQTRRVISGAQLIRVAEADDQARRTQAELESFCECPAHSAIAELAQRRAEAFAAFRRALHLAEQDFLAATSHLDGGEAGR